MNIVVSSSDPERAEHVHRSINDAIAAAYAAGHARLYGIGGAGVYRAMLPIAERLLITEVDLQVTEPDTWFPAFDEADYKVTARIPLRTTAPACTLVEYLRR